MSDYRVVLLTVEGLVQGIGFRPFVAECAEKLGIEGTVRNSGGIVTIYAKADRDVISSFAETIRNNPPYGAVITSLSIDDITVDIFDAEINNAAALLHSEENGSFSGNGQFFIVNSSPRTDGVRLLPPDMAVCDQCTRELLDPENRRYRYPFISCVACGPRFSIMHTVPYDRDTTTMDRFRMCPPCRTEYTRPGDIRRHAQTISCHDCGPQLWLEDGSGLDGYTDSIKSTNSISDDIEDASRNNHSKQILHGNTALTEAIARLKEGQIGAILDIGGFHFAFSPYMSAPARRLRVWKNREAKPFAVMFPDIETIRKYCKVSDEEEKLLKSNARPIVLLDKKTEDQADSSTEVWFEDDAEHLRAQNRFAREVLSGSNRIGAMLPCSPLQILILRETGPLVMTSGNRGGEPIVTDPEVMREYLQTDGPDFMLAHDRQILTPLDDSIYQVVSLNDNYSITQIIRRARGLVPEPVDLPFDLPDDLFAAGGDLKAVFALARKNKVYLSAHFGDLDEVEAATARTRAIAHMEELLDIHPAQAVCDMHPAYISSKETVDTFSGTPIEKNTGNTVRMVQHHLAHVASVIAEYDLTGHVIGLALDGTGYGTDGRIWGSEFFSIDIQKTNTGRVMNVSHVGSLRPVKMIGGDAGSKDAVKTLICYLNDAGERHLISEEALSEIYEYLQNYTNSYNIDIIKAALQNNINTIESTSMGRLYDAVSALLGICMYNSYEGECPTKLQIVAESISTSDVNDASFDEKEYIINGEDTLYIDGTRIIADIALAMLKKNPQPLLARRFHTTLAKHLNRVVTAIAKNMPGNDPVIALGGGTFLNRLLVAEFYKNCPYKIYINEKVPSGDGGLALGQVYLGSCHCSYTGLTEIQ